MITKADLQDAIAECESQKNPTANTCVKLAAFYTLRREMFGEGKYAEPLPVSGYSYAADVINNPGQSEFARAVDGRSQQEIWPLMDEMMDTIHAIHPRLYRAVMDRLR